MENVSHIYKSCDPSSTDAVLASALLNFIKPYLLDDLSELDKLQTQLDPDGNDPVISSSFFYKVMSDWIAKFSKDCDSTSQIEIENNNMKIGEEEDSFLSQSGTFDFELTQNNISNTSNSSNLSDNTIVPTEEADAEFPGRAQSPSGKQLPSVSTSLSVNHQNQDKIQKHQVAPEEQIQKLQFQLQKVLKDLELVKQQLASAEEQNESLSAEVNRLQKLHNRKQEINEEIIKSKLINEEIKEEANLANKKIQDMRKTLLDYKKQNQDFQAQIDQLENENGDLNIKIQKLEKNRIELRKSVIQLEDALDCKDLEITSMKLKIEKLESILDEKLDLINFYVNENNLIKEKVKTLKNLFQDLYLDKDVSPNNTSADLFSIAGIVTVLHSPQKTLKEELSEVDSEEITSASSVNDDESFVCSCSDELINNEYLEIIPFETDSFLDNLELNEGNLKNLSHKEMEDKFTTLALILTMDFATSNKRYFDQKDKCDRMFMKFFTCINNVAALTKQRKPVDQCEIDKNLKLLKNLSEEALKSAFRCGVLQYERSTIKCWNLVINYVATLSQKNKQIKNEGPDGSPYISKTLTSIPIQNQIKGTLKKDFIVQARSGPWETFKCFIVTFLLVVFVLFVICLLYVDSICLQRGKQVECPVEWLLGFLVKRIHSHQIL